MGPSSSSRDRVSLVIQEMDKVLFNLGDNIHLPSSSSRKRSIRDLSPNDNNHENNTLHLSKGYSRLQNALVVASDSAIHMKSTDMSHCHKSPSQGDLLDSPVGLESQHRELFDILYRGLIGGTEFGDTTNNHTSRSNNSAYTSHRSDQSSVDTNVQPMRGRGNKKNVSALLMGPRGQGKSLVLERCLHKLQTMNCLPSSSLPQDPLAPQASIPRFRIVRLNGILLRGHDVSVTVKEIARQLGHIALEESTILRQKDTLESNSSVVKNYNSSDLLSKSSRTNTSKKNELQREAFVFRSRKTSFHSMISYLDEILQLACIDSIPILIVLDELDSFLAVSSHLNTGTYQQAGLSTSHHAHAKRPVGKSQLYSVMTAPTNRQLLLYHLLDRVADHRSLLSFVGLTSRLSTVGMFEKRVKSRAEGTSKVIYFGHSSTYDCLVETLLSKFTITDGEEEGEEMYLRGEIEEENMQHTHPNMKPQTQSMTLLNSWKEQLRKVLIFPPRFHSTSDMDVETSQYNQDQLAIENQVRNMFYRSYQLGKDTRWFCRVLSVGLSLAVEDYKRVHQTHDRTELSQDVLIISPVYLLEGLIVMGCACQDEHNIKKHDSQNGPSASPSKTISFRSGYSDPRIQALMDLSGAHLAVLFSAKRILCRDMQGKDAGVDIPLTYERIQKEYSVNFIRAGKSSGPDRYEESVFFRAFCELESMGLIRPAIDHSGGGPLQYNYVGHYSFRTMDILTVIRLPLHVNVDVTLELGELMKKDHLFSCTTALREWGLKNT